jgi:diguanylate cyclase (GGDEF)-like protein/PAS domain S-box-containing protein
LNPSNQNDPPVTDASLADTSTDASLIEGFFRNSPNFCPDASSPWSQVPNHPKTCFLHGQGDWQSWISAFWQLPETIIIILNQEGFVIDWNPLATRRFPILISQDQNISHHEVWRHQIHLNDTKNHSPRWISAYPPQTAIPHSTPFLYEQLFSNSADQIQAKQYIQQVYNSRESRTFEQCIPEPCEPEPCTTLEASSLANLESSPQGILADPPASTPRQLSTCRWLVWTLHPVTNPQEHVIGMIAIAQDVTAQRHHEIALQKSEIRYRSIFENTLEGIFQTAPDGSYLNANPALAKLYGYSSPQELITDLQDISQQLYLDQSQREDYIQRIDKQGMVAGLEYQVRRKDGKIIWLSETSYAVRDNQGDVLYYEGIVEDITNRKKSEEQQYFHAFYDALTSLPNRTLLLDRLELAIQELRTNPSQAFGVLLIDFDRFKRVNDSLGHGLGDRALVELGQRLVWHVRATDTVARLSSDEFAILLYHVPSEAIILQIAAELQAKIRQPLQLDHHEIFLTASIGATWCQHSEHLCSGNSAEIILRQADTAMGVAKKFGRDRSILFTPQMTENAISQLETAAALHRGLERQEFYLCYQPIIDLSTGILVGFEALARWDHPKRGFISPTEFIPIAEDDGSIVALGTWALQEACRQLKEWQQEGIVDESVWVGANVAGKQFADPCLVKIVQQALTDNHLAPACLHLEITESAIVENHNLVDQQLHALKSLGLRLGIDDFGTGYSSLSRLLNFPIDILKIDRSFISGDQDSQQRLAVVKTILNLANSLGLETVAEGVETEDQHACLMSLNCHYGQGYRFAPALRPQEVHHFPKQLPIPSQVLKFPKNKQACTSD